MTTEIEGGRASPASGRSVSVKDVAAAAGVSLGTVSNVLNRPEKVSEVTRDHVLRVIDRYLEGTTLSGLGMRRSAGARLSHQERAVLRLLRDELT